MYLAKVSIDSAVRERTLKNVILSRYIMKRLYVMREGLVMFTQNIKKNTI